MRRVSSAIFLAAAMLLAAAGDAEVLTLEDVVRAFVEGQSSAALVARIEGARVDFDLSDEMLEELRMAGLPGEVIEAMRARQHELHPPPAQPGSAPPPAETAPPGLTVVIGLRGAGAEQRALRLLDRVPPEALAALGVRDDRARIDDVALYVACLTATHVPDQWRGHSPLGRDFASMPRHELLAFVAQATREESSEALAAAAALLGAGAAAGAAIVRLDLPAEIALPLDPTLPHDLSVGVAVRIDGRYFRVASHEWRGFVPGEHDGRLAVRLEAPTDRVPWSVVLAPAD